MDLTPGPEVYLAAALAQQVAWRPDEDNPDWQRRIAERMAEEPAFRMVVDEAFRAGREAAARDLEAEADDEARRPSRAEPSEIVERWLREAARIAREESSLGRSGGSEAEDGSSGTEAFIPRGDLTRSMSIVEQAARWYTAEDGDGDG